MTEKQPPGKPEERKGSDIFSSEHVAYTPGSIGNAGDAPVDNSPVTGDLETVANPEDLDFEELMAAIEEGEITPDNSILATLVRKGRVAHSERMLLLAREMEKLEIIQKKQAGPAKTETTTELVRTLQEMNDQQHLLGIFSTQLNSPDAIKTFCLKLSKMYEQKYKRLLEDGEDPESDDLLTPHSTKLPENLIAIAVLEEELSPDSTQRNHTLNSSQFWSRMANTFAGAQASVNN